MFLARLLLILFLPLWLHAEGKLTVTWLEHGLAIVGDGETVTMTKQHERAGP